MRQYIVILLSILIFCSCGRHMRKIQKEEKVQNITWIKRDIDTIVPIKGVHLKESIVIPKADKNSNDTVIIKEIIDTPTNTKLILTYNVNQQKITAEVAKEDTYLHVVGHISIKTKTKVDSVITEDVVKTNKELMSKWDLFWIGIGLLCIVSYFVRRYKKKK